MEEERKNSLFRDDNWIAFTIIGLAIIAVLYKVYF